MALRSWKVHATRLLLAAALVVIAGWVIGLAWQVPLVVLMAYLAWHLANLWRLYRWLQIPGSAVPESIGLWSDIYERIAALEKENRQQNERFRGMIADFRQLTDAFPDATLVIDRNACISWFNRAATRLLELRSPEDLGKPVTNLLRGPDFANWLAVQDQVRSPLEMASPRSDNIWLSVSAFAFQDEQRLIVLRDHTEVHNVEQIRRDFVANVSHELRTPLTVLQGYLELLDEHRSNDVGDAVERMLAQTAQMRALLDDLLELSRLQSDEIHGEEDIVDMPAMLKHLGDQAEELSRGRHELVFQVDERLWLAGVASDLESAFGNLISNAVKYTPEGGRVEVTWTDGPGGPRLEVRDTGIGIPSRAIPRLTERFYRVGSDRARQTGGTGLGLSIVKHVLNVHQATLEIESDLGEGSSFSCTFPGDRRRRDAVDARPDAL